VESRNFVSNDEWRGRFKVAFPEIGRSRGASETAAWSNSRDAGQLLGVAARLHPQMRGCIEALGVGDGHPRWVPDAHIVRASADDPQPLWGALMGGPELRLRLALMGWARGQDLAALDDRADQWEPMFGVEQVRKRAVRKHGERTDRYDLDRALENVRLSAMAVTPANLDPRGTLREELYGPHVPSRLEQKIQHIPEAPLDDYLYRQLGWQVRPPTVPSTGVEPGVLAKGWHLVAPPTVLGWMVALPLLPPPVKRPKPLGERHLGLKKDFQVAARARYFLKLARQSPDLATLTLQRSILGALAVLEVVPPTITDIGVPIQTLLVGTHNAYECCAAISGDHLRVWYRDQHGWSREPFEIASLHAGRRPFSMTLAGDNAVILQGIDTPGIGRSLVLDDLTLHTFPFRPSQFPDERWRRRTGLDSRYVAPARQGASHGRP
jgi:hypothetical protein